MQVGGVGSGSVHTANSHQVTDCVHGHQKERERTGPMDALPHSASKTEQDRMESQAFLNNGQTGESLGSMVKRLLGMGKSAIGRFWNETLGDTGAAAQSGISSDADGDGDAAQEAAHTARMEAVNPLGTPEKARNGADSLWQRFKLKVYTATGYLAKRFGRGNFLQTDLKGNQGGRREDSRRRTEFRDGRGRIEAVPEDRSYLMDSYDKTGKYVRLGQEGRGSSTSGKGNRPESGSNVNRKL